MLVSTTRFRRAGRTFHHQNVERLGHVLRHVGAPENLISKFRCHGAHKSFTKLGIWTIDTMLGPYEDPLSLFIAATLAKADDIPHFVSLLDGYAPIRIADVCGGYGRVRLHWPHRFEEWRVIDKSAELIGCGRALVRDRGLTRTEFWRCDMIKRCRTTYTFDLIICAYNSINEIEDLRGFFRNCCSLCSNGGYLILKAIHHTDSRETRRDELGVFRAFDDCVWQRHAENEMLDATRQVLRFVYHKVGTTTAACHTLNRIIWPLSEIDAAAEREGFRYLRCASEEGYRLYDKEHACCRQR